MRERLVEVTVKVLLLAHEYVEAEDRDRRILDSSLATEVIGALVESRDVTGVGVFGCGTVRYQILDVRPGTVVEMVPGVAP